MVTMTRRTRMVTMMVMMMMITMLTMMMLMMLMTMMTMMMMRMRLIMMMMMMMTITMMMMMKMMTMMMMMMKMMMMMMMMGMMMFVMQTRGWKAKSFADGVAAGRLETIRSVRVALTVTAVLSCTTKAMIERFKRAWGVGWDGANTKRGSRPSVPQDVHLLLGQVTSQTISKELMYPTSSASATPAGFRILINGSVCSPMRCLTVTGVTSPLWKDKEDLRDAKAFVVAQLRQSRHVITAMVCKVRPVKWLSKDVQPIFQFLVALESENSAIRARDLLAATQLPGYPSEVCNAPTMMAFRHTPPAHVRMTCTDPVHGVRVLLQTVPGVQLMVVEDIYTLYLCIWADNWQAVTVARFWLIDVGRLLFPSGRSEISVWIEFVGGEGLFPHYIDTMIKGLNDVANTRFHAKGMTVEILVSYGVFDHCCLLTMSCVGGGESDDSDALGANQRCNWSLVHSDSSSRLEVRDQSQAYIKNTSVLESIMDLRKTLDLKCKPTLQQALKFSYQTLKLIRGRFTSLPLLHRGDLRGVAGIKLWPPMMHNIYHLLRITIDLVLPLMPKCHPLLGAFYAWFAQLEGMTKAGQIVASFARTRKIASGLPGVAEPALANAFCKKARVYAWLPRLATLMSKHLYAERVSTPKRRFQYQVLDMIHWILCVCRSNDIGGRKLKRKNKNHTENLYFNDQQHAITAEEHGVGVSPYQTSEEAGEASFNISNHCATERRSQTDLEGEREWRARVKIWDAVLPAYSRGGPAFSGFADVSMRDVWVHPSFMRWQTTPVGQGRRQSGAYLAGVNIRILNRNIFKAMGQAEHVERTPNGGWMYRLQDAVAFEPREPPIILCMPETDGCTCGSSPSPLHPLSLTQWADRFMNPPLTWTDTDERTYLRKRFRKAYAAYREAPRRGCACPPSGKCVSCWCVRANRKCTKFCHQSRKCLLCTRQPPIGHKESTLYVKGQRRHHGLKMRFWQTLTEAALGRRIKRPFSAILMQRCLINGGDTKASTVNRADGSDDSDDPVEPPVDPDALPSTIGAAVRAHNPDRDL